MPTLAELGQPAANLSSLFGIYAPAQTPAAVVARLNAEVNKALALPDIRAKLDATDNVPTGGTAAEFARQIAQESENNARIVRAAGIQGMKPPKTQGLNDQGLCWGSRKSGRRALSHAWTRIVSRR